MPDDTAINHDPQLPLCLMRGFASAAFPPTRLVCHELLSGSRQESGARAVDLASAVRGHFCGCAHDRRSTLSAARRVSTLWRAQPDNGVPTRTNCERSVAAALAVVIVSDEVDHTIIACVVVSQVPRPRTLR